MVSIARELGLELTLETIEEVNGKEEAGDLMFEVVNNEERGIYTYLEYMTIMILTLGIEVIVLFRKKEEVNEEK